MSQEARSAATSYRVEASATVYIDVSDPDVIERVTGPNGDEWRQQFYPLRTVDDVLHHFAYNAIANGVLDVRRLDGWADVAEDAVTVVLDGIETHTEPWHDLVDGPLGHPEAR